MKRLAWIETLPVSGIPFAPDPLDDFAWSMSCDNIFSQSEGLFVNKQIYIPNHDNMYRETYPDVFFFTTHTCLPSLVSKVIPFGA